jgi:ABC-type multidrug transport system fused ATPase/permease subunit
MKGIIGFYQFVRDQQKKQLYLGLILTLLASALEGCSIMTLLPLLRLSQIDPKHAHSMLLGLSLGLTTVLLLFLSILVISSVIRYCSSIFNIRLNIKFANDFRNDLFANITAAKWAFLKSLKSGHLNNMLLIERIS